MQARAVAVSHERVVLLACRHGHVWWPKSHSDGLAQLAAYMHVILAERSSIGMQEGGMVRVTPPPASLVREDVLEGVRARAQMVADHLGLNGLAQLDAFMHADSADLVVVHAHAIPDLSSTSDLFQQVGGHDVM